jgi:hypothetical protein
LFSCKYWRVHPARDVFSPKQPDRQAQPDRSAEEKKAKKAKTEEDKA